MSPETVEGEVVERGIATVPAVVGTHALANLSDQEFETNLAAIRKGQERIKRMQLELLVKGVDYANIPNVDKPSLGKPGAEKLCLAYGLAARIETILRRGDGATSPLITYDAECHLHLGSFDGLEVGVGHGTCNSWEVKYRYRDASYVCPECGKELRHSKAPKTGWYCWAKLGGCGREFPENEPRIKSQTIGRIENPDPSELANTIMKMAEKRAHVDATLRTTAASGIFTQDLEDNVGAEPAEPAPQGQPQPGEKVARRVQADFEARKASPNTPPEPEPGALDALVAANTAVLRPSPGPVDPTTGLSLAELQRRANEAGVLITALNRQSVARYDGTIASITDAQRLELAAEAGLA
jgi:hypothetical protein